MTDTPMGAILAGGASQRMGRDKATVELDGKPLVLHVAAQLKTITPHVIVVGRDTPLAGLATVPDHTTGRRGPAAGLETALLHAAGQTVILTATDQPFVRARTLRAMLELPGDCVVPIDDGIPQTTCAIYRQSVLAAATQVVASGDGSLRNVLDLVAVTGVEEHVWRSWGEDGRSWFSIDTEGRLAVGRARYATGSPAADKVQPDPPS